MTKRYIIQLKYGKACYVGFDKSGNFILKSEPYEFENYQVANGISNLLQKQWTSLWLIVKESKSHEQIQN